ncbi:hypothetical protein SRHO_G00076650, partial [Serrasalmus rhombeus]
MRRSVSLRRAPSFPRASSHCRRGGTGALSYTSSSCFTCFWPSRSFVMIISCLLWKSSAT